MNTKTMEQFEVMDVEMLASVEGGYSADKCLADIGWGMVEGVVTGAIAGGLMGAGIGFGLGQIGGSIYCIGSVNWVVAGTQCLGAGVIGLIGGPWTALGACVISGGRSITGDLLN